MRPLLIISMLVLLGVALLHRLEPIGGNPAPAVTTAAQEKGPVTQVRRPSVAPPQALPSASPIIAFEQWLEAYRLAAGAQRIRLLPEGERLAKERRTVLYDLMARDPEAVLRAALPEAKRKFLPASVQALVERRISARGDLAVVGVTPRPGRKPEVKRAIYREARIVEEAFDAYVYGRRARQDTKYGTSLMGVVVGDRMAVLDEPARVISVADLPSHVTLQPGLAMGEHAVPTGEKATQPVMEHAGQYAPVCCVQHAAFFVAEASGGEEGSVSGPVSTAASPTQGAKSVLVIVARFSDFPDTPTDESTSPSPTSLTSGYVQNRLGGEVSDFFEQCSYGKSSIGSVTVTTPLMLSGTLAGYATSNQGASNLQRAAISAATSAGYSTGSYDRVAVVFASTDDIPGNLFGFAGLADIGGNFSWFNGYFSLSVVAHELGHNYGLRHANLWDIPAASTNPVDPLGSSDDYGDVFDVMGDGPGNATTQPSHFNPWFLNRIDWLPNTAVSIIEADGTYRLYRFDHAGADLESTRALKLQRNDSTTYWLGLRRKYLGHPTLGDVASGAYITWGYETNVQSNLIDIDTPGADPGDASLNVGSTFNDTAAGIAFNVTASGGSGAGEYIDVQVTFQPRLIFSQSAYDVDELAGSVTLTVHRRNRSVGAVSVNYATSNGSALAGSDYTTTNGTLNWASGDVTPRTIDIPILNDPAVEGAENFSVAFTGLSGAVMPNGTTVSMTIQEAGALDTGFVPPFLTSSVHATEVQSDHAVVISGNFNSSSGSIVSPGISRLKPTGGRDVEFDQGSGVDIRPVVALALQQDGKVLLGGSFTSIRGAQREGIARLNRDGSLDNTFEGLRGNSGEVKVIVVQPDGKILVGGDFLTGSGTNRRCLIRLNEDGTLDTSFANFDGAVDFFSGSEVNAIALQPIIPAPHYRIIVGGFFFRPSAGGGFHSGVVALNALDGTRDASFNPIHGAHAAGNSGNLRAVGSLALQPDGKILVGGQFGGFNNVTTGHLVRLTSAGANDASFVTALGAGLQPVPADDYCDVLDLVVQNDGKVIVGGFFDRASGANLPSLVRYTSSGTLDSLFAPPLGNAGGTYGLAMQVNGKLLAGFSGAGSDSSGVSYALRRYFTSMPQAPSVVQFAATSVSAEEGENAVLTVQRTGGSLGAISVNYSTIARSATASSDYTTTTGTLSWASGESAAETISIPLLPDALLETAEIVEVRLGAPVGGLVMGANQLATVTIQAGDLSGVPIVRFAAGSSAFGEGAGTVPVTVTLDPAPAATVAVAFTTSGSATQGTGKDYTISASPVTFLAGETSKNINVTILQDGLLDPGESVALELSTITGTALPGSPASHTVTITDDEAAPVITLSPVHRIGLAGGATTFQSTATASPAPTFQWRKGTANIAGATAANYTISKLALTHAGSYSVVAKSLGLSTPPSTAADLVVIDPTAKRLVVPTTSAPVKMTALYAGNVTGFQWQRNSANLSKVDGDIDDVGTKTLTLTGLTTGDSGSYNCVLTSPTAGTGSSGVCTLKVTDGKPEFQSKPPTIVDAATVGAAYSHQTDLNTSDARAPVTLTATGLPPGMKIDINGLITGTSYVSLTAIKDYTVTIKATNSHGSDSYTTKLTLKPLPSGTVGSFAGSMPRDASVNDNLGGRFDLTVMSNGTYTVKLINGTAPHSYTGLLAVHPSTFVPSASVSIARHNDMPLVLSFAISPASNNITAATLADGGDVVTFNAWRHLVPTADYLGYYTFGMDMPGGIPTAPQGTGYGYFTVASTGKLTISGKLADGLAFTTATFVGSLGEVMVHQSSATADTIVGVLDIMPGAPATLTGTVTWSRKPQAASSRLYEDSFAPITLTPVGGIYVKPASSVTDVVMGLPYTANVTTTNATLTFTGGDFGTPPVAPTVPVLIKPGGATVVPPVIPLNASTNARKTTLKVTPSTGIVSGGFTMVDPNPLVPATNITRAGTWYGIIFLDGGVQKCRGFFLLNNLPAIAGETKDNTDTISGPVVLQ